MFARVATANAEACMRQTSAGIYPCNSIYMNNLGTTSLCMAGLVVTQITYCIQLGCVLANSSCTEVTMRLGVLSHVHNLVRCYPYNR